MKEVLSSIWPAVVLCGFFVVMLRRRGFSQKTQAIVVATLALPFLLIASSTWRASHTLIPTSLGNWWRGIGIGLLCVGFIAYRLRSLAIFLTMSCVILTFNFSMDSPLMELATRSGFSERMRFGLQIVMYLSMVLTLALLARRKAHNDQHA